MDDFEMEGEILSEALDKIATINQLLGGNKITIEGIAKLLVGKDKSKTYSIVDIGCGNGDMLRKIADFGLTNNYNFQLKGVDANQFTINYAKKLTVKYPNIEYHSINIFDESFDHLKYDIALLTLTLHHFSNSEIQSLLDKINKKATIGIVVNDLQRSITPYRLFQFVAVVFNLNKMSKQDGLVSILRGFKKQDLVEFCKKLHFKNYSIKWKWAFRYQWIIWK
jgi:2-polyprenyl-3-methyl-5-hydroxy-6-metoxy-1,4-benzoquinol methylase